MAIPETFHFLRPEWFWAALPLLVLVTLLARSRAKGGNWQSVVDPALLPHLLVGEDLKQRRWPLALITLAGLLAITALAGPVWQKLEQPVFSQESSLVILLDLSRSMDATDTKPSRLARAKLKLKDILERRHEGETALIVYAADAFVVTPLSSDTRTIASQLSGLTTDLMPAQGSRPDLALSKGRDLLRQASRISGSLLLVSDGIEGAPTAQLNEQIGQLRAEGHQLLLLGVGSEEGAPIPMAGGGFMKDRDGNIVLASLDATQMQSSAQKGGGIYQPLSADERDINALLAVVDQARPQEKGEEVKDMVSDQWQEEGAWLLLPLMLLSLLAFRRGVLLLALVMVLPLPREGMAAPVDLNIDMDALWQSRDQQAQQAFEKGDSKGAAELFENKAWRAAAQYRAGNYQQALDELQGLEGSEAAYNRGNALSQLGQLEPALEAYEEALKLDPKSEDAAFNRDKVKQWLKETEQQNEPEEESDDSSESQDDSGEKAQGDESEQSQSSEAKDESSPSESEGEQQKSEQTSQQSPSDQPASDSEGQSDSSSESSESEKLAQQQAAEQLAEELSEQQAKQPVEEPAQRLQSESPPTLSPEELEMQQATEQWLRRIPDDPSGLWRRKFEYQYKQQQHRGEEEKPW